MTIIYSLFLMGFVAFFVYRETGIWTAAFALLTAVALEWLLFLQNCLQKRVGALEEGNLPLPFLADTLIGGKSHGIKYIRADKLDSKEERQRISDEIWASMRDPEVRAVFLETRSRGGEIK